MGVAAIFKKISIILWLGLLPVVLGLPFIGRAPLVDDHYHITMAQGLLEHPFRPYDFLADDAGPGQVAWKRGSFPRMVNPPLHHYLLAAFLKVSGGRVHLVRLGFLFISGLSAVFIFLLARRWGIPPVPVTVLCVLTPAFWLSSHSLLIDSTMLMFFLGALFFWVEGLHKNSWVFLVLAGCAMGCAVLTKYTGGFVVFLAVVWWFLKKPSDRRWSTLLFLLIPFIMFGIWTFWNVLTYGAPHLTEASKRVVQTFRFSHVMVVFVFFSGVLLLPLVAWKWILDVNRRFFFYACFVTAGLTVFLSSSWGGFTFFQALLLAFLFSATGLFLFLVIRCGSSGVFSLNGFLLLWLFLGLCQLVLIMGWVAARYYLTLAVPMVFLLIRMVQIKHRLFPGRQRAILVGWGIFLFVFSFGLCVADYAQARTNRLIREDVFEDQWRTGQVNCFYLGDTFTGSPLASLGWRAFFEDTSYRSGDYLLMRTVIMPPWWFRADPDEFSVVKIYQYPSRFPLRVMDNQGAAGFYASVWGALPWTFSRGPLEKFVLLRANEKK